MDCRGLRSQHHRCRLAWRTSRPARKTLVTKSSVQTPAPHIIRGAHRMLTPKAADADFQAMLRHEPSLRFGKRRAGFAYDADTKSFVMRSRLRFGAACPRTRACLSRHHLLAQVLRVGSPSFFPSRINDGRESKIPPSPGIPAPISSTMKLL